MKKYYYFIIFILTVFTSCRETTTNETRLSFLNNTSNVVDIEVFPKAIFSNGLEPMYRKHDGSTGLNSTTFVLDTGYPEPFFTTDSHNLEAHELVNNTFDSIQIVINKSDTILFTQAKVLGYEYNLFDSKSPWELKAYSDSYPTMIKTHPVDVNEYIFIIENRLLNN